MAAALTGIIADQGAGQLQMLFESDSESGSEISGFSADESDDENDLVTRFRLGFVQNIAE